jgi:predicted metal-dependent hydrolase
MIDLPMIDWIRRKPAEIPTLELGQAQLPVVIKRLKQARRLTLRLSPAGDEVRVSMPIWGQTADALQFAISRKDWLATQLHNRPAKQLIASGSIIPFCGLNLAVEWRSSHPRRPIIASDAIRIGGPEQGIENRLRLWLMAEARTVFAADLAHYCALAGQSLPRLILSSPQRRWGSCSGKGEIRLNWRLIMAPPAVRRSVVAHEVAHLLHFDHSPAFYAALDGLFEGDMAGANHWLKQQGRSLYAPFG